MHFLGIDIGSTNCKCQLFSDAGEILSYRTREYPQLTVGADVYIHIAAITENAAEYLPHAEKHKAYETQYAKYKKVYDAVKELNV